MEHEILKIVLDTNEHLKDPFGVSYCLCLFTSTADVGGKTPWVFSIICRNVSQVVPPLTE